MDTAIVLENTLKNEAKYFLAYYALYVGSLFLTLENELAHWITLVLLPMGTVLYWQRKHGLNVKQSLASMGMRRDNWRRGLLWCLLLGLGLSVLQLFVSEKIQRIRELFETGDLVYLLPLAFLFLLLTAGFTEEVFFRGVLQTRLGALTGNRIWAVLITSVLFGLYHLPYAYLNPNWSSYGDFGAALGSSMSQGIMGGLILGAVYEWTDRNLAASVLVHTMINLLPATTIIQFGG